MVADLRSTADMGVVPYDRFFSDLDIIPDDRCWMDFRRVHLITLIATMIFQPLIFLFFIRYFCRPTLPEK